MTVQQRFRRQGFDGAIGPVALRRSVAISLRAGWGRTLVAVGGAALLVALALWASTGMAVAVVAVGVGVTGWGWQRAQQRKTLDLAHRKGPDLAHDELARLWTPVSTTPSGVLPPPRMLRALLSAEACLSRRDERNKLLAWCTDPAALPVRVLAGAAGAGKSRLAVEVARALPEGWTAGIARPGRAAQILPAAVGAQRPVLIVVDDADTEPAAEIAALYRQAGGEQRVQVRVLLVVRDADAFGTALRRAPVRCGMGEHHAAPDRCGGRSTPDLRRRRAGLRRTVRRRAVAIVGGGGVRPGRRGRGTDGRHHGPCRARRPRRGSGPRRGDAHRRPRPVDRRDPHAREEALAHRRPRTRGPGGGGADAAPARAAQRRGRGRRATRPTPLP